MQLVHVELVGESLRAHRDLGIGQTVQFEGQPCVLGQGRVLGGEPCRGPGLALSYGAYRQPDGSHALPGGVWDEATHTLAVVDLDAIREDATHAWLAGETPLYPREGHTEPRIDKPGGYTWNKAPRLAGRVVETGAIARQLASGHALIRDAVAARGSNVRNRVLARLLEVARVLPMMEAWLAALAPREAFFHPDHLPADGEGVGLTEAARGALGNKRQTIFCSIGGFDTHGNHDGAHLPQMGNLLLGVDLIAQEIAKAGLTDKVVIAVGSDFGRTPAYNAGNGKDHWNITSMMFIGPGITGNRVVGGTDDGFKAKT